MTVSGGVRARIVAEKLTKLVSPAACLGSRPGPRHLTTPHEARDPVPKKRSTDKPRQTESGFMPMPDDNDWLRRLMFLGYGDWTGYVVAALLGILV